MKSLKAQLLLTYLYLQTDIILPTNHFPQSPSFIRCLKPNIGMVPGDFSGEQILTQLRSAGNPLLFTSFPLILYLSLLLLLFSIFSGLRIVLLVILLHLPQFHLLFPSLLFMPRYDCCPESDAEGVSIKGPLL